jgi:chromosomal replication initiator protein
MSVLNAWNNAQPAIKKKVGEASYQSWFSSLTAVAGPQGLILRSPDEFYKNWIADHYLDIIRQAVHEAGGEGAASMAIELTVSDTPPDVAVKKERPPAACEAIARISNKKNRGNCQTRFNFENFVIGSSNQFACKASQAVADAPAKAYNPLFIYGQSGMGKTHLMHAIANHISKKFPDQIFAYLTSEQFTNELIDAIRNRSTQEFRQKYRNIDILLIDDIQFIGGKESTQEEFFHTFNELHTNHKQIVITADRPAKEIAKLEDRLVTRFTWGLSVDIQPPDFETRVAILRKKLEVEEITASIPDDVIYFIAEQIKTNIRELEGALIRVIASSLLEEKPISLSSAKNVLKDMVNETIKAISLEMVIQAVCDYYKVSVTELKAKKRNHNIVVPRQIAMYLARKMTRHSLPEIGNALGGRDHTTVIHSFNKIEKDINTNSEIRYSVENLTDILNR